MNTRIVESNWRGSSKVIGDEHQSWVLFLCFTFFIVSLVFSTGWKNNTFLTVKRWYHWTYFIFRLLQNFIWIILLTFLHSVLRSTFLWFNKEWKKIIEMVLRTKHGYINIRSKRRKSSNKLRNEKTGIKQRYFTNAKKKHNRKKWKEIPQAVYSLSTVYFFL